MPRDIFWEVLEKKGVYVAYIEVVQDMHDKVLTQVRMLGGEIKEFFLRIVLQKGSSFAVICSKVGGTNGKNMFPVPFFFCKLMKYDFKFFQQFKFL